MSGMRGRYLRLVDRMPVPGDISPGFIAEIDRCWRTIYDRNLQAAHCRGSVELLRPVVRPVRQAVVAGGGVCSPPHRGADGIEAATASVPVKASDFPEISTGYPRLDDCEGG